MLQLMSYSFLPLTGFGFFMNEEGHILKKPQVGDDFVILKIIFFFMHLHTSLIICAVYIVSQNLLSCHKKKFYSNSLFYKFGLCCIVNLMVLACQKKRNLKKIVKCCIPIYHGVHRTIKLA